MTIVDLDDPADAFNGEHSSIVARIMAYLCRSTAAPNSAGESSVEYLETHLSHVFLCRDIVYKLLKPVKFDFVDFSTVDRRREECRAEVELNRRLAGDVYLAAEPVRRFSSGEVLIGENPADAEQGTIVDWAIKMRRLPDDRTLAALIKRGEATVDHIQALSTALARSYSSATRSTLRNDDFAAAVERHIRDNLAELSRGDHALPRCLVERIHAAQLTTLALCRDWFDRRVEDGCIIEGHGDLRPEHVYFLPQPVVIDCLAFSRDLRTLDVADEIAFLAIELHRIGAAALADDLVRAYEQNSADHPPAGLWAFYQTYRACVRAKVAVLRAGQLAEPQRLAERSAARAYLDLADAAARPLERSFCIVVRGLSGTGKSTFAAALANKLGIGHLQTDRVRKQLFPGATPAGYGKGCYTSAARRMVYDAMLAQACERLAQRQSVILDGTFLTTASRAAVADAASRRGAVVAFFDCHCPIDMAAKRIAQRAVEGHTESDAGQETLHVQAGEVEPDPARIESVRIDTTKPIERQLEVACQALRTDAGHGFAR